MGPFEKASNGLWRRGIALAVVIVAVALALPEPDTMLTCRTYVWADGEFVRVPCRAGDGVDALPFERPLTPPAWRVAAATLTDVTGDGAAEWVLLVWRPWEDWPIQRWSSVPSPIAAYHDATGDSSHVILLDPGDGREIWAGSALARPLLALAAGDVDGDGRNEIVALEGDYATGRQGPATFVTVWRWNGFGFTLIWRSPRGCFRRLFLTPPNEDGILSIITR